jgi:hypothetical protein
MASAVPTAIERAHRLYLSGYCFNLVLELLFTIPKAYSYRAVLTALVGP